MGQGHTKNCAPNIVKVETLKDIIFKQKEKLNSQSETHQKELEAALIQISTLKSLEREEEVKRASNNEYANRIVECLGTVRELLKSNKTLRA